MKNIRPISRFPIAINLGEESEGLSELAVGRTADGSDSKNKSLLYFSDPSARLQGWNTKVQLVKALDGNKLASTPLLIFNTCLILATLSSFLRNDMAALIGDLSYLSQPFELK
ncbi:hypothetical protein BCT26_00015 [Vibrio lentus]|nr:hypothetical protein BCU96_18340 [Vibrio lentus]PMH13587.1 hypothetical protein BCU76_18010 [Vibrio lentus]PMJ11477.1 hypothetical protein BCU30_07390 [Vibrio lentus]PMK97055.1 hypothetical protein BCT89_10935 [Vibrio lentus]PMN15759.1 hypothetical protein BCT39_19465 [Vibrio lentus]